MSTPPVTSPDTALSLSPDWRAASAFAASRSVRVRSESSSPRTVLSRNAPTPSFTVFGRGVGAAGAPPPCHPCGADGYEPKPCWPGGGPYCGAPYWGWPGWGCPYWGWPGWGWPGWGWPYGGWCSGGGGGGGGGPGPPP